MVKCLVQGQKTNDPKWLVELIAFSQQFSWECCLVRCLGSKTTDVARLHTTNVPIYMYINDKLYTLVMNKHRGRFGFLCCWGEKNTINSALYVHSLQTCTVCCAFRLERWLCVTTQHQWSWNRDYSVRDYMAQYHGSAYCCIFALKITIFRLCASTNFDPWRMLDVSAELPASASSDS